MNLTNEKINQLFDYTITFIETKLEKHKYNNDIKHLLYIIIPAFIIKYGLNNKDKILKIFETVPININKNDQKIHQAYYMSIPFVLKDKVIVNKYIVVNYYEYKPLIELIDNIVHEYNHAANSYINHFKYDEKYIYLRTGLMYIKYNKTNISDNAKDDAYILEEIIDIINSFNKYDIKNETIKTTLYNIKGYIKNNYSSEAYLLQSTLCKELMSNKTLINVLSNMRFQGNVDDIPYFFDNITGINNSYNNLIKLLNNSIKFEEEYSRTKIFKKRKLRKLKKIYYEVKDIVDTFNTNYHFK